MAAPTTWPAADEIVELEVDVLGYLHPRAIDRGGPGPKGPEQTGFIASRTMEAHQSRRAPERGMNPTYSHEAIRAEPAVARALSEAWEWLVGEELIALDAVAIALSEHGPDDPFFVTRWGSEVAAEGTRALDLARARRRLGLELHPRLSGRLQRLVRVGAFEEAAFVALREVEQRVGDLAQHPTGQSGSYVETS